MTGQRQGSATTTPPPTSAVLSNNLDVVTAESGLLAAESRRIQALADSAVARLRLRALLGVFNPRTDLSDSTEPVPMSAGLGQ